MKQDFIEGLPDPKLLDLILTIKLYVISYSNQTDMNLVSLKKHFIDTHKDFIDTYIYEARVVAVFEVV